MNSIFSSFDALSAEFLGQKVISSVPPTNKAKSSRESSEQSKKLNMEEKKKRGKSSPPAYGSSTTTEPHKSTRIAPEWDGLYCFETIIHSY